MLVDNASEVRGALLSLLKNARLLKFLVKFEGTGLPGLCLSETDLNLCSFTR